MIFQGLKLTILGMMVVFSFLGLLLIVIHILKKVLGAYSEKEALSYTPGRFPGLINESLPDPGEKITAIISAAVAAHRARFR